MSQKRELADEVDGYLKARVDVAMSLQKKQMCYV